MSEAVWRERCAGFCQQKGEMTISCHKGSLKLDSDFDVGNAAGLLLRDRKQSISNMLPS
jgi:hypothetical protein